jgi:ATP phosphoribosyltransferase regulatory subunit
VQSDVEIQRLLARSLEIAGVRGARIDIGHVAVFRALVRAAEIAPEVEAELFEALQRKDVPALRALTKKLDAKTRAALMLLPELYGGAEVLDVAARRLPSLPPLRKALATLRTLGRDCAVPASFDLAELRGYHYHSGVVFDAYCDGPNGKGAVLIARGGRYDEVGKAFGRPRPATGFSIGLRELAGAARIAPWSVKRAKHK